MTTISFTSSGGSVQIPNALVIYMYSPFPVIVRSAALTSVTLTLYNQATYRGHSETRELHDGKAEFDIARTAQILAQDVDDVFRMNLSQDGEAAPYTTMEFELEAPDGAVLLTRTLFCVYGAQDQAEGRFMPQTRRFFVNYPQTLQVWKDSHDEILLSGDYITNDFYPALSLSSAAAMVEMDLMLHLGESNGTTLRKALLSGKTADITASCRFGGFDTLTAQDYYELRLVPDLAPRGTGTFLRWLHRDGTFGYWHFENGVLTTGSGVRSSFRRHIDGNPAEPVSGAYRNGAKADFSESRQIALGTKCETSEEFDYLCGLVTSPVVERLIEVNGADRWQRVNVVPGSYARNMRFDTPSIQLFELAIELPQRNTVSL